MKGVSGWLILVVFAVVVLAYLWLTGFFTPAELKATIESVIGWFRP